MTLARGSVGPREFVRLTPLQFSLSVGLVVLFMAGAGLAGYFYGLGDAGRKAALTASDEKGVPGEPGSQGPETGDTSSVTFYSVLTEPRKDIPDPAPRAEKPAPPKEETAPAREEAPAGQGGSIMAQVASHKTIESAQSMLESLSAQGYRGNIEKADLGERGTWYRVRIGPFRDEEEAGKALERLRAERNLKGFIVR